MTSFTTDSPQLGYATMAAVRQYLRFAEDAGLDTGALLQKAGIDTGKQDNDGARITGAAFQRLLQALIAQLDDPLTGLRSGDYVQPGSYTVVGYITMSCATLGEAIARIAPYERLVGDMGVTEARPAGSGMVRLHWHCAYTDPRVRHHMIDNVFQSWIGYARWLADREDARPVRIELEHASPGAPYEAAYRERWQCPVLFDQPHSAITLDQALLDTPLRQPDPLLRQTLEAHALEQINQLPDTGAVSLATRVSNMIRQQLREGITRQDVIAGALHMTARTLQRKLHQEGLSYQGLLDGVRAELARDYLARTGLSIQEIGLQLGFSETRSFQRQFKRWTGQAPSRFRRQQQAQDASPSPASDDR